jgi:hypothetical protein
MSDKEWNAEAFAKHIIEGVGGMNDCERYELAVFPLGDRVAAVEWTLRCLANPECEGSAEVLAAIAERRRDGKLEAYHGPFPSEGVEAQIITWEPEERSEG